MSRIELGHLGEYGARSVTFNLSAFKEFGPGTFILLHQRSRDFAPYIVEHISVLESEYVLKWDIDADDTACEGIGLAEIQLTRGDELLAKSDLYYTFVDGSLGEPGDIASYTQITLDAVAAYAAAAEAAKNAAVQAASQAQDAAASALSAVLHTPIIGDNGNWFVWFNGQYVDTGYPAQGPQGDPGSGVPSGGLRSQALVKFSDADGDAGWGDVAVTQEVIRNELYSVFGAISDLVVDELRTDYQKAARYLAGNTNAIDFLHIYDVCIDLRTGTVKRQSGVALTEQLHHGDEYYWWTDSTHSEMTSLVDTGFPVIVYQYDEIVRGTLRFEDYTHGNLTSKLPTFILGEGNGDASDPSKGKGFVRKSNDSFDVWLHNNSGEDHGIFIGDQYTDIVGLRKTTVLDLSEYNLGQITETVDGGGTEVYSITWDGNGRPVRITDSSGHSTEVVW